MKEKPRKNYLILNYGLVLVPALALFVLRPSLHFTEWYLAVFFLALIFYPGYAIYRILKPQETESRSTRLISILAWGFAFNLTLAFVGMGAMVSITVLSWVYLLITFILMALSFILDWRRGSFAHPPKLLLEKSDLLLIVPAIFAILVLITIGSQGADFKGDPFFHLSIARKALDGSTLNPTALGFVYSSQLHAAYGLPVWHTFLALWTKLSGSGLFNIWFTVAVPLTVICLLVWYWVLRLILPSKAIAALAFLLFLFFTYHHKEGYMFTRLPVPDTLNQLILLPLIFGLALKYIFEGGRKFMFVGAILALFMAAIHMPQYFYFLLTIFLFLIVYVVMGWILGYQKGDYKPIVTRIMHVLGLNLAVLAFVAVPLELKGKTVTNTFKVFWEQNPNKFLLSYRPFKGVEILAKYTYIAIPLIFVLATKYKRLLFLAAISLVMPLAYSQTIGFIRYYLMKSLGFIFMNRLYANLTWDFAVWGLFLGAFIVILSFLIRRLPSVLRWLITGIFAVLAIILLLVENKSKAVSSFYFHSVASDKVIAWLNSYYYWVILGLVIVSVAALVYCRLKKTNWAVSENFDIPSSISLMLLVSVFFLSQNFIAAKNIFIKEFKEKRAITRNIDRTSQAVNLSEVTQETVDYIKNNIPHKSIIFPDKTAMYVLPFLVDQHMAFYPHSREENRYKRIFLPEYPLEQRLDYVYRSNAQYLLFDAEDKASLAFIQGQTEYFELIYLNNKMALFKINKEKVKADWKIYNPEGKLY